MSSLAPKRTLSSNTDIHLNLLVLRCRNIDLTRNFYEKLGLRFIQEQHGNSPVHYAAELDGGLVLELYPAKDEPDNTRLGFITDAENRHILQDPDGRYVEIRTRNGK